MAMSSALVRRSRNRKIKIIDFRDCLSLNSKSLFNTSHGARRESTKFRDMATRPSGGGVETIFVGLA